MKQMTKLALNIPAPRRLSDEEMRRATEEARELRRAMDIAFEIMERFTADDMKIIIR